MALHRRESSAHPRCAALVAAALLAALPSCIVVATGQVDPPESLEESAPERATWHASDAGAGGSTSVLIEQGGSAAVGPERAH